MEPSKETKPLPPPSLFSSLPQDILLNILARMSRSYYLDLSLVSKSFRSLILSKELAMERKRLGTRETLVSVCFQRSTHPCDILWFSLLTKPDDHETLSTITHKSTGNWLLPVPSSYSPGSPIFNNIVGSETYQIGGQSTPSSSTDVLVQNNKLSGKWCKAPSMNVARKNPLTASCDGKIYVIGGCEPDESTYWAEVFDTNTQTWEPLPDPGPELRFSAIKSIHIRVWPRELYVRNNKENLVYIVKENRWDEALHTNFNESRCEIEDVCYAFYNNSCLWYDTATESWAYVRGLDALDRHFRIDTEIGNYGGNLAIFWVGPPVYHPLMELREIWCAVISLQKGNDGELYGHIEWEDVVLQVPHSYTLLRCAHSLQ